MDKWVTKKISDIGKVVGGATPSTKDDNNYGGDISWITPKDLASYQDRYISHGERNITRKGFDSCSTVMLPKGSVLFSSRAPIGYVAIAAKDMCTNQGFKSVIPNETIDSLFLYYLLRFNAQYIAAQGSGTTFPEVSAKTMASIEISLPESLETQKRIAHVLDSIDSKIECNRKTNDNLLQQVMTLYKDIFSKKKGKERNICRADEYFDISIGKTPPRKEFHWFSDNSNDIKWVSISDLGSCGVFISDSSEYLTKAAVDKFNIIVVPDNNVLLSFKLTVGRVAITDGCMATNEAIAHFKTENKDIIEYLYCYLKSFNFEVMGSTSSIATAVNSKIIKSMPFVVPADTELSDFHKFACPIFNAIKLNQRESRYLETLRDILLPKLISGEIELGC